MEYVALLRGINVGGNNKVVMSELREQVAAEGFANVRTYINSGNLGLRVKMCVWLGVSRGLDLAFLNAD